MSDKHNELAQLRSENARLIALLESRGIKWCLPKNEPPISKPESSPLTTDEKITLFRRLFQGRSDVYPIRWESKAGKSGYSPACANDKFARRANLHGAAAQRVSAMDGANEWKRGVCNKPRIKCADCSQRSLLPVTDQTIFDHLAGNHTIGVYPLLSDDTCSFV